jgi:hypothetical protein
MITEATIHTYFNSIHGGGWEDFVSDDIIFIRNNLDNKTVGRDAYLQGAGAFFKNTTAVAVQQLFIKGDDAAVLAHYTISSPHGKVGYCDVAEFLTFKNEKLTKSAIFFDMKMLGEFMVSN